MAYTLEQLNAAPANEAARMLTGLYEHSDWIAEQALDGDAGGVILRRVVDGSGRSRAFINGHAATLAQLREWHRQSLTS